MYLPPSSSYVDCFEFAGCFAPLETQPCSVTIHILGYCITLPYYCPTSLGRYRAHVGGLSECYQWSWTFRRPGRGAFCSLRLCKGGPLCCDGEHWAGTCVCVQACVRVSVKYAYICIEGGVPVVVGCGRLVVNVWLSRTYVPQEQLLVWSPCPSLQSERAAHLLLSVLNHKLLRTASSPSYRALAMAKLVCSLVLKQPKHAYNSSR